MKNTACEGNPLTQNFARREFFYVGLLGGLGLTLPQFLRMKAEGAQKHYETKTGVAHSVINIFLPGGMAHQESFDPKPYAPSEYRGPFGSINTAVKGVRFGSMTAGNWDHHQNIKEAMKSNLPPVDHAVATLKARSEQLSAQP